MSTNIVAAFDHVLVWLGKEKDSLDRLHQEQIEWKVRFGRLDTQFQTAYKGLPLYNEMVRRWNEEDENYEAVPPRHHSNST